VAYGALNASRLVEWLETAKLLGASKVFMYTHNLNTEASKVLAHYSKMGLVSAVNFDVPELGILVLDVARVIDIKY